MMERNDYFEELYNTKIRLLKALQQINKMQEVLTFESYEISFEINNLIKDIEYMKIDLTEKHD